MNVNPYAATAAIAAMLLVGCQQHENAAQTSVAPPPVQVGATDGATTSDPSLPPAESAVGAKSDQDAAKTPYNSVHPSPAPAAETGGDARTDSAVTPTERDREMPMKGQVNDHSTPDRAKEGDQPNTASKEPGGQEAHPGNLTSNAKEAKQ